VLEGEPIVIIQDGELIEKNVRRERMTADEVAEGMRMQQVASFDEGAVGDRREQRPDQLRQEVARAKVSRTTRAIMPPQSRGR